jgi:CRISPR-associated protein Cmr1
MRFWFRALMGGVIGPNLELLAELEHRVFGSTAACCPVPMRIPNPPPQRPAGTSRMPWGICYLLGQGLGDLGKATTIRPYVAPGPDAEFDLELRLDRADVGAAAATLASLWLLCAYGGIGARTRRGFGGVRIIGAEGWLPPPWTTESILSPNLDHYEKLRYLWLDATLGNCLLPLLQGKITYSQSAWEVPPTFPVLHRKYTIAGASGGGVFDSWADTLRYAGQQLRYFRASQDNPAARYTPARKTPEWERVIWGAEKHFPLGALGLPVVFKKNGPSVNAERNSEQLRRASPLWLRAVGCGDEWRLFSFAFLGEFLPGPNAMTVFLRNGGKSEKLQVDSDDISRLTRQWIDTLAADESFFDIRRR